jgi:hypothetical protein
MLFPQKRAGTADAELVFLHPVQFAGHVVQSGVSGMRNANALFFMLERDRFGYNKKCVGTRYAGLVFLHLVRSLGHVVHSSASRVRNVDA